MSGQIVARIVDPSVEDWEDEFLGDSPFVPASAAAPAAGPAAAGSETEVAASSWAFEPEPDPAPTEAAQPTPPVLAKAYAEPEMWPEPPTQPLGPREVERLLAPEPDAAPRPNPVGDMIADVEQAMGERSLPRIGLDVFALQASTREVAEKGAADRRFQRSATTVRPGVL